MAGLISPSVLEQVRGANDIVDVIGGYIPLKKAGANFQALCPFHREKTPSFNVSPQRQIFHCFGCHKGGDVFTFVREYESISFVEAVKRLADRARIPLELEEGAGGGETRQIKERLREVHEQLTRRWQSALQNEAGGEPARAYLRKRGISDEAVRLFRLGYAVDAWDDTVNWGKGKGYSTELLEEAGLILRRDEGGRYYDRFRGRLIFPICDEQGRVIGFSGRLLAEEAKAAKYVNSPETPIFVKGKVFFGLDKSKRAVLDADCAIVCEGQVDLIACFMAGVENVVAPQGTALTGDHARILKRYASEVVLCFDSDRAGQAAAVRSLDGLLEAGLAVRVAVVPPPHDPDSFIRERGVEAFRTLISEARSFFDFYLDRLCQEHDVRSDRGKLLIVREMVDAVRKTGSMVLVDDYAQKTALRLGVAPEAVRGEFRKEPSRAVVRREAEVPESAEVERAVERPPQAEFWLLRLLLREDALVEWVKGRLDPRWLTHAAVRRCVALRVALSEEGMWSGVGDMLGRCEESSDPLLIREASVEERPVANAEELLKDTVRRLRDLWVDRELVRLQQEASRLEAREDQAVVLRRREELRALKREPLD